MRKVKSIRQLAEHHPWTPESEFPNETVYNEFRSAAEDEVGSMLPGDHGDPLEHVAARHVPIAGSIQRRLEAARAIHSRVEEAKGEAELRGNHCSTRDASRDGITGTYNPTLSSGKNLSGEVAPPSRPRASGPNTVRGFRIVKGD